MSTTESNPIPDIPELEKLITGIHDVTGCRIIKDAVGEITEIHVTAISDRSGRIIARDVDTLLNVKAGLDVDHRKIGVAVTGKPEAEDESEAVVAPAPSAPERKPTPEPRPLYASPQLSDQLIIEDEDEVEDRPIIRKVGVFHEDNQVHAEVTLALSEDKFVGEAKDADTPSGHIAALIRATLEALLMIYDSKIRFSDPQFRIVTLGNEEVFLVHLSAVEGRNVHSFAGSAIIRQDSRQTAVMATLGALNRIMGLWARRATVEYDIL
ncbi:hypothetical protein H8E52_12945 [bacterium]|nr:hypothetical protein [bacterium]